MSQGRTSFATAFEAVVPRRQKAGTYQKNLSKHPSRPISSGAVSKRNRSISAYNDQELRSKRRISSTKPGPEHNNCDSEAEASKYRSLGHTSNIFPNLENITEFLISLVHDSNDPRTVECKALLQKVGDRQPFQQFLLDCIKKEARSLENTQDDQSLMKQAGGYLDYFVADDCDYCRFFVSQSIGLEARMSEQSKEIYSSNVKSLHYYVCALGNGHRTPNFIRLFTLTESKAAEISIPDEHETLLLLNLPETVNAIGFRTLPKGHWPDSSQLKYWNHDMLPYISVLQILWIKGPLTANGRD
ncbi:MAG: hypothetical protein Q9213_006661 [Squamulea squamosa]